jgi:hypothetical protein
MFYKNSLCILLFAVIACAIRDGYAVTQAQKRAELENAVRNLNVKKVQELLEQRGQLGVEDYKKCSRILGQVVVTDSALLTQLAYIDQIALQFFWKMLFLAISFYLAQRGIGWVASRLELPPKKEAFEASDTITYGEAQRWYMMGQYPGRLISLISTLFLYGVIPPLFVALLSKGIYYFSNNDLADKHKIDLLLGEYRDMNS